MARKKKSRKIGQIGVRKSPDFKRVEKEKRVKKALGNPAGNRNNLATTSKDMSKIKVNKDPRLGSKKPIELLASVEDSAKVKLKPVSKNISPESELALIESDEKLSDLITSLDAGKSLSKNEQIYVNKNLERHKELCELLGLSDHSESNIEETTSIDEDELYDMFEKIDVNKLNTF
jgi:uncharacterized protein